MSEQERFAATAGGSATSFGALEHPFAEVRRQSVLVALARQALDAPIFDDFLTDAAAAVGEGLGVDLVGILELLTDRGELRLRAGTGWSDSFVGSARFGLGAKSQAGYTLVTGRVASSDLERESRFQIDPFLEAESARSGISVTIPGADRPFGVLTAHVRRRRDFQPNEVDFLRDVAQLIGKALVRDRMGAGDRARSDRVEAALAAGGIGVWEWSAETGELVWSETLERIHGLDPGRFGGTLEEFARRIHSDDRERVLAAFERVREQDGSYKVEYRAVWPDGTVHWVQAKGAPVYDAAGRPIGLAGVCLDIDERRRFNRRRDTQYAITRALAEAASLEDAAPRIVAAVCTSLAWDLGAVWEVDQERETIRCVDLWCAPGVEAAAFEQETRSSSFTRSVGLPGRVWADAKPHWIPDVVRDSNFPRASAAASAGLHGAFAFPILLGGRVGGVVEFFSHEIREPDDDLLAMVEAVGSQLGQYVERKNLERELRLQTTLLEAESEAAIDGILVVSADSRVIYFNRRFVELWEIPDEIAQSGSEEAVLAAVSERVADRDAFLERIADLNANPDEASRVEVELEDGRVFDRYSAPVRGEDGTCYGRAWFFRDVTDRRRQEEGLRFLAQASELLSESLDYEETLAAVARLAVPELADWCVVDMLDDRGRLRRLAVAHVDPDKVRLGWELSERYPTRPDDPAGPARVVQTGLPELAAEIPEDLLVASVRDDEHLRIVRELAPRSYVCVPLRGHRRVIGAITFVYAESGRRYDEQSLALAQDLARHAVLAIENSRLYKERSEVAETLQRSLLPPRLPTIPGVEIAARYLPVGDAVEVGGDFYDVFQVREGVWAFAIGDVCGKGPQAAALTGLARHTIRAVARHERTPSGILAALNDMILTEHGDGTTFCTVACGLLELVDDGAHLTIACAGHPAPFVLRMGGATEEVGTVGTLLGVFSSPTLTDRTVELGPGDALVLYTDGVTSGRVREDGLSAVVASCAGLAVEEIAEGLETAAIAATGSSRARDDIAILVLRVTPLLPVRPVARLQVDRRSDL